MQKRKGRVKDETEGVRVNVYFDESVIVSVDWLAEKAGISRSRLVSNLVAEGVKGLERAELVGILDFALLMRDFGEGVKAWARGVRDEGPYRIKRELESRSTAQA